MNTPYSGVAHSNNHHAHLASYGAFSEERRKRGVRRKDGKLRKVSLLSKSKKEKSFLPLEFDKSLKNRKSQLSTKKDLRAKRKKVANSGRILTYMDSYQNTDTVKCQSKHKRKKHSIDQESSFKRAFLFRSSAQYSEGADVSYRISDTKKQLQVKCNTGKTPYDSKQGEKSTTYHDTAVDKIKKTRRKEDIKPRIWGNEGDELHCNQYVSDDGKYAGFKATWGDTGNRRGAVSMECYSSESMQFAKNGGSKNLPEPANSIFLWFLNNLCFNDIPEQIYKELGGNKEIKKYDDNTISKDFFSPVFLFEKLFNFNVL